MIRVEVAYAMPEKQVIIPVEVLPNATIEDAIWASGILVQFPEIDLITIKVGVFAKLATLTTRLKANDRVEIYRPLTLDPKQARRQRLKRKSLS